MCWIRRKGRLVPSTAANVHAPVRSGIDFRLKRFASIVVIVLKHGILSFEFALNGREHEGEKYNDMKQWSRDQNQAESFIHSPFSTSSGNSVRSSLSPSHY